jgi:hypothetical protein
MSIDDVPSLLRTRAIRQPDAGNRDGMDRALRRLNDLHRALTNLANH